MTLHYHVASPSAQSPAIISGPTKYTLHGVSSRMRADGVVAFGAVGRLVSDKYTLDSRTGLGTQNPQFTG